MGGVCVPDVERGVPYITGYMGTIFLLLFLVYDSLRSCMRQRARALTTSSRPLPTYSQVVL